MTITEPIDGGNPSDNLICPRCGTSLPPDSIFCSSCGERIKKKKNEEEEVHTENGDDDAQEQGADETVRLPSLSQAHLKVLQSYRSLRNDAITEQTYKSSSLSQDVEAPVCEELSASSVPATDIDTQKHGAVLLSQHLKQQIARPPSKVGAARQQIVGMLRSNSGSTRSGAALMERAKEAASMKAISDEAPEFPVVSSNNSAIPGSASDAWGWLPALSLTSAVGVFLVALAAEAGRAASRWADLLFWLGLLVLLLPIVLRLLSSKPARRERIALLVVLGSALYLFRDLEYPLSFAYNDEFLFWRGAQDLATSRHLFGANPLLPVGPFYPGLEILINALSGLTGLSIFVSGLVVLGVSGLIIVLSLYLFYEYLSSSAQVAGIATLLYMANLVFFGDTLFHYQSLAIPLAAFVLFALVRRSYAPAGRRRGLTSAIWLGLAAVVITHHLTSYALVTFLLLWTATFLLPQMVASFHRRRDRKDWVGPGGAALLGLVMAVLWLQFTGDLALGHLIPSLDSTVRQLIQVLASERAPRQLFHDGSGFVEPLWERVTAFTSVGLILLGLPFGLFQIWRRYRTNAIALALAIGALVYPFSQLARLTPPGVEIGARAQAFLFVSVAFVLAVAATHYWVSRVPQWRYSVAVTCAIAVIFIGGWILGTSPLWYRLPGPYVVSADHRSIEPESVAAAEWARSYLGPGYRMISDSVNMLLMATYGNERIVTAENDKIAVSSVFVSPHYDASVERALRRGGVQYIVVDRRLSSGLPPRGSYFYEGDPNAPYTRPIDPAALAKFDGVKNVSRAFDSGDIVIYDVEASTSGPSATSTPKSSCTPVPLTAVSPSYPKLAKLYTGTIYDIPTDLITAMSLTGMQQQQGNLCGSFTGLNETGTFIGSITTDGHIQFVVTGQAGQALLTFDGLMQPDGTLAGNYCRTVTRTCSDYGIWSLSPRT